MSDKTITRLIWAFTVFVIVAVGVLNRKVLPLPGNTPDFVYRLPKVNAVLNATCSLLLLLSFYFIRQKNIAAHRKLNITALILSAMFLCTYITYHWLIPAEATFPKDNSLRPVYLFILISHITLAMVALPLVLMSFHRGLKMEIPAHKRLVRWAYPIWLYVTVSGVVVYLMMAPYYRV
jgi:putative membrane protein